MKDPHLLESPDDLFALLKTMPEQDRFNALGIFHRMQSNKITIPQAIEEFKVLFFKNGNFEDDRQMGDNAKIIINKLNESIKDLQSELSGGGDYKHRAALSGEIKGLQYAKLLVSKLEEKEDRSI